MWFDVIDSVWNQCWWYMNLDFCDFRKSYQDMTCRRSSQDWIPETPHPSLCLAPSTDIKWWIREKEHHWRAFRESLEWWYYTCPWTPGRLPQWRPGNFVSSWSAVSRVCRDPSTAHRFARQTHPASMASSCWDQWTPRPGPTRKWVLGRQKTGSPWWLLELTQADAHIMTHRCVHCVSACVRLSIYLSSLHLHPQSENCSMLVDIHQMTLVVIRWLVILEVGNLLVLNDRKG